MIISFNFVYRTLRSVVFTLVAGFVIMMIVVLLGQLINGDPKTLPGKITDAEMKKNILNDKRVQARCATDETPRVESLALDRSGKYNATVRCVKTIHA